MHHCNRIHSEELRRRYSRADGIEAIKTFSLLAAGIAVIALVAWFESTL